MRVIYQAVSSLDFVIRVHAFLDVRLRNGHMSVLFGLSSLSVETSTGRGCKIRSGTLDRKRRHFSSETGTRAFVSLTRDSIFFRTRQPQVVCLPSSASGDL